MNKKEILSYILSLSPDEKYELLSELLDNVDPSTRHRIIGDGLHEYNLPDNICLDMCNFCSSSDCDTSFKKCKCGATFCDRPTPESENAMYWEYGVYRTYCNKSIPMDTTLLCDLWHACRLNCKECVELVDMCPNCVVNKK